MLPPSTPLFVLASSISAPVDIWRRNVLHRRDSLSGRSPSCSDDFVVQIGVRSVIRSYIVPIEAFLCLFLFFFVSGGEQLRVPLFAKRRAPELTLPADMDLGTLRFCLCVCVFHCVCVLCFCLCVCVRVLCFQLILFSHCHCCYFIFCCLSVKLRVLALLLCILRSSVCLVSVSLSHICFGMQ